jgi:hypothetical protein
MISGRILTPKGPSKDLKMFGFRRRPAPRSSKKPGIKTRETLLTSLGQSWKTSSGGVKLTVATSLERLKLFKPGFRD